MKKNPCQFKARNYFLTDIKVDVELKFDNGVNFVSRVKYSTNFQ